MDNRTKWIETRLRLGWIFLVSGGVVALLGIFIRRQFGDSLYNFRTITGLGIFLIGIGIAYLVHYGSGIKNEQSAMRLRVEERDERTLLIRARAGNRAFWCSSAMIYTGLMWESFAANGGVPALTGDALWFSLAAAVLIPFGVYMTSILIDQRHL